MSEEFSNSAELINQAEKFSKSSFNKKAELIRIYEEALKSDNKKTFEDLAFTAKYLRGLMRVMQQGPKNPEVNSVEHVKKDFSENMKKVIDQIKELISNSDENLKQHFEENFFEMSQEGLTNLNELLADLEWVKIYLNDQKRK